MICIMCYKMNYIYAFTYIIDPLIFTVRVTGREGKTEKERKREKGRKR